MVDINKLKAKVQAVGNLLRGRRAISPSDLRKQAAELSAIADELETLGM